MPTQTESETGPAKPRFHQAYRWIAERISEGELAPGDPLPSERWIGGELGVSRTTVRRAIDELVRQGLIEETARGLRIAADAAGEPEENRLLSLTEMARARGLVASARVLEAHVRPATLDEADAFQVAPGAPVFELRRLRMLDGLAVAVDHDRVPVALLDDPLAIDFTTASFYTALEACGTRLDQARTQIEAAAAGEEEGELLGLEAGAPVLVALEQTSDRGGRLVSLGRTVYRSDRHRFLATFTRRSRPTRARRRGAQ